MTFSHELLALRLIYPSAPLPFHAHVNPSNPAFLKPSTPGF